MGPQRPSGRPVGSPAARSSPKSPAWPPAAPGGPRVPSSPAPGNWRWSAACSACGWRPAAKRRLRRPSRRFRPRARRGVSAEGTDLLRPGRPPGAPTCCTRTGRPRTAVCPPPRSHRYRSAAAAGPAPPPHPPRRAPARSGPRPRTPAPFRPGSAPRPPAAPSPLPLPRAPTT